MTDEEFYARLCGLTEEAELTGLSRKVIIEDLRLLANSLEGEGHDR